MILIISSKDDQSTNDVIDWLRWFNAKFIRICSDNPIEVVEVEISDSKTDALIEINSEKLWLSEIKSVWYRRSWMAINKVVFNSILDDQFSKEINDQLSTEGFYLNNFIDQLLIPKMLNKRGDVTLNKLSVLKVAKQCQLSIPKSWIVSRKDNLKFLFSTEKLITKNFSPGIFVGFKGNYLNGYTLAVTEEMIKDLPDCFHPMLFQEFIEKSFEIRAFYLNRKFYCTAIFSQNDENTKLDFRNYNFEKPNRTPPFVLPNEIVIKLIKLCDELGLNSGSIDLLVTPSGEFIFLEVNPIGQFAQVSNPCNFKLEKLIAESLFYNYHERRD